MSLPKFPAIKILKKPGWKSVRGINCCKLGSLGFCRLKLFRFALTTWKKVLKRRPLGGRPGIVPGNMVCGHKSFWAGAPSITGGTLMKVSSSLGNLNPASLKALPKSLSLGKSTWQVLQDVPYWRENAGMAKLLPESSTSRISNNKITVMRWCVAISLSPFGYEVVAFAWDWLFSKRIHMHASVSCHARL